ncbi:glycosyltransferase [Lysobacter sp. HX-5-24]|uniref:Glycosyltransferase n=2 Tax=Noviluteimonas gilva TaxID=2682097 RepID=A0A7C9LI87_9GAMM|nr:glycosyltransferase [Lysobacter gilvus]
MSTDTPASLQPQRDAAPAMQDSDAALLQARRDVLSYKYEVDRLYTEYQRVHGAYAHSSVELLAQYNKVVDELGRSRLWQLFTKIAKVWSRIRYKREYTDVIRSIPLPRVVPPAGSRLRRPELPDIGAIEYRAHPVPAEKTWEATSFLSHTYYNKIETILARQPEGQRRVFVQSAIIDWFVPLFQRPQHMALAMARQGYLVFYVTANMLGDRAKGFHEVAPNVFITNQPAHLMVDDALVSCYSTVATLLSWQADVARKVRARNNKLLYEYIDHIDPEISFHTTGQLARQFALVDDEHIDLGLASAATLREELRAKLNTVPVTYVPNGVDTYHYDEVLRHDRRATVPPDMRDVVEAGRPIVGYFGAMAPWLWYEAMNELAKQRPDLSFVYIGPDYLDAARKLESLSNVYALGAVDYAVLPYFAQHFDVAIIPFKQGEIARTTSPLKLFEYFALGLPVVVTQGMEECEQFPEVLTAGSAEAYSVAIDEALSRSRDPEWIERFRALAEENTWDKRAQVLSAAHDAVLENKSVSN